VIDYDAAPSNYEQARDEDEWVALAVIMLESTLSDTILVVAVPDGDGWRFEVVDEYETAYALEPSRADEPLTLRELIELIDSATMVGEGLPPGVIYGVLALNELIGSGELEDARFVHVHSPLYPGLQEHYERQVVDWVMGS
jgi:hypothetical protein